MIKIKVVLCQESVSRPSNKILNSVLKHKKVNHLAGYGAGLKKGHRFLSFTLILLIKKSYIPDFDKCFIEEIFGHRSAFLCFKEKNILATPKYNKDLLSELFSIIHF